MLTRMKIWKRKGEIKMKKSKLLSLSVLALLLLVLTACGNKSTGGEEKTTITVGTSPGPYSELFLEAVKPILEEEGFTIKTTDFTELLQADIALSEGSVDLNVDQHTAYLENFNDEKSAKLTSLTPIPTVPAGVFPGRKDALEDLTDGDVIGIPKDPSNAARAYALLQKAELITLKEDVELVKATLNDIEENPYNLDIMEMDSAQIPRALEDMDFAVIPGSIVYSSGVDASLSLLSEDVLKNLELVATVDESNKDTEWAKAVADAYQSDEFKAYLDENNKDGYWFIPEELR